MLLEHVHVAHVAEGGEVRNEPREPDLRTARIVRADAERTPDRAFEHLERNLFGPVRAAEIGVHRPQIQPRGIVRKGVGAVCGFHET